jgi:hypothetical protein
MPKTMNNKAVTTKLRVEYTLDPESHNWCFVVPGLHIVGGSDTREDAEREVIDAVAFALRYYGEDRPAPEESSDVEIETEVSYLEISVGPPLPPQMKRRAVGRKAGDQSPAAP